jgi:hypothetical protein
MVFFIGSNTEKIVQVSLKSMRCRTCELAKSRNTPVPNHACRTNYEGSSGGMEPDAALEMIQAIQELTSSAIHVATLCADDDTSLRCLIRNVRDGGELKDSYITPSVVSDPGQRTMARTFEFAMRSAIRANCGSDVTKLQHATKAPLLHMFDIHTNCEESFCSVRRSTSRNRAHAFDI